MPAYDTGVAASGEAVTSVTTDSLTIASGSNRCLLVFVYSGSASPGTPGDVKWGGSGGTSLGSSIGGDTTYYTYSTHLAYKMVAPTAQTSTVYASSFGGASWDEFLVHALVYTDVDQTTPTGTINVTQYASASPSSLAATSAATTDRVVAAVAHQVYLNDATVGLTSIGTSYTQRLRNDANTSYGTMRTIDATGTTSADFDWSWTDATARDFHLVGVPLKAAASGPTLSSPGVINITSSTAQPQVTIAY